MSTDARETAWRYYQTAGRDMEADLAALGAHPQGVVVFMPQLVVLMKPAVSTEPEHWPQLHHVARQADSWYVHLLAGDLKLARRMAAALPPQRWLCFHRGLRSSSPHRLRWSALYLTTSKQQPDYHHGL